MLTKVIKFFKEDFWNFMWSLPKCEKGGYCNQNNSQYYIKKISAGNKSTIVSGFRYYCNKCNNNTSEYGKF